MVKGKPKNDHGRGFTRSRKQWECSAADHIGKFIDKLSLPQVLDALAFGACAYYGYKAFGVTGLAAGPIALKLATSENIVPATSGVATLAIIGLANQGPVQDIITALTDPTQVMVDGELFPKEHVIAPHFSSDFPWELTCPEGYILKRGLSAAFCVLSAPPVDIQPAPPVETPSVPVPVPSENPNEVIVYTEEQRLEYESMGWTCYKWFTGWSCWQPA